MLARFNRFHGHNSLRFVYSQGKVVRGPLFSIKYHANPKRKHYRLAVVVSKKVCKSAVGRNRIRRRLYEIFRQDKLITTPYDIVITVFSEDVRTISHEELRKALAAQVRQAGLGTNTATS